ncbi:chitin deacetylase [Allomyces arbusculus]|nr:chitin deacetylase [Allomyces arbusculus]
MLTGLATPLRCLPRAGRAAQCTARSTLMAFCVLVAAFMVMHVQSATTFAQLDKWCFVPAGCALPPRDLVAKTERIQTAMFGEDAGTCGDGICNVLAGETCYSCAADCGACTLSQPLTKCKNPNHFALTFDDGPSPLTENLVKILNAAGIKATFFVIGNTVAKHPELWKAVKFAHDSGHDIGAHMYSHRSLGPTGRLDVNPTVNKAMTVEEVRTELVMTDLVVQAIIGRCPRFLRPPYLEWQPLSMQAMDTYGYIPINVNVDPNDWQTHGLMGKPESVVANFVKAFENARKMDQSFISLQHDTFAHSIDAVPAIIQFLKAQNVELVPMRTCLGLDPYRAPKANPFLHDRFAKMPIFEEGAIEMARSSGESIQTDDFDGQSLKSNAPVGVAARMEIVALVVVVVVGMAVGL